MPNKHVKGVPGSQSRYSEVEIRAFLESTRNCSDSSGSSWPVIDNKNGVVSVTTFRRWRKKYGADGSKGVKPASPFQSKCKDAMIETLQAKLTAAEGRGNFWQCKFQIAAKELDIMTSLRNAAKVHNSELQDDIAAMNAASDAAVREIGELKGKYSNLKDALHVANCELAEERTKSKEDKRSLWMRIFG